MNNKQHSPEFEQRVELRLKTIAKNKSLQKFLKQYNEDYSTAFKHLYKVVFGETIMRDFNNTYKPVIPLMPFRNKACILDYVDCECLRHYIDCINRIMQFMIIEKCSFKVALGSIVPLCDFTFIQAHPEGIEFLPSIAYQTKKQALQNKGNIKNENGKPARQDTVKQINLENLKPENIQQLTMFDKEKE